MHIRLFRFLSGGLVVPVLLAGCVASPASPAVTDTPVPSITLTPTEIPSPTPTPQPLALVINGEGVPLSEYEASLKQLQEAQAEMGMTSTPEEQRRMVLDDLIAATLLAQEAFRQGFTLIDADLDARITALAEQRGGMPALQEWMSRMGYDESSFRSALRRSLAAAWMRDTLAAQVPERAEQVHARQILLMTEATAKQVLNQIRAGANFATLAFGYDLTTGGDLGWFPRGYLTQPAVEEAAFALQPGEVSDIIQTELGYHILQVVERETDRPLSPDARLTLQRKVLEAWLEQARSQARIEERVP